jgi:phenylpropionate dioxygenase-like ring-hydroxylating dioxygenase large terminal subunit
VTADRLRELALAPWRVEICGRLVFVCRDSQAPDLKGYLGEAFAMVKAMTHVSGQMIDENVMTIRANWKALFENTLESYHVNFFHPNTFSRPSTADGVFEWQQPYSRWCAPLGAKFAARLERPMTVFVSRPWKTEGYLRPLGFPNLTVASTQGTSFSVQFFEPVDPDTARFTTVVFQTRLHESAAESAQGTIAALNESVKTFNRVVFGEDKEICEQVQRGTRITDQPGLLSDEELRVFDF